MNKQQQDDNQAEFDHFRQIIEKVLDPEEEKQRDSNEPYSPSLQENGNFDEEEGNLETMLEEAVMQ